MATEKQIAAARANGAKSRGPISPEGKAKVSQNAFKHGVYARRFVLSNEDNQAYLEGLDELLQDWQPATAQERRLVETIHQAHWRCLRVAQIETALFDLELARSHKPEGLPANQTFITAASKRSRSARRAPPL